MLEAHATGNPARDRIELAALRTVYRGPAGHCALGLGQGQRRPSRAGRRRHVPDQGRVVAGEAGHSGHRRLPAAAPGAGAGRFGVLPAGPGRRLAQVCRTGPGWPGSMPATPAGRTCMPSWPRHRPSSRNRSSSGRAHRLVGPHASGRRALPRPAGRAFPGRRPGRLRPQRGDLAGRTDRACPARRGDCRRPGRGGRPARGSDPAGRITAPSAGPSRIAFLFPGQGAQQAGLAQDLYDRMPSYAKAFDECLDLFEATGLPLRRWWRQADQAQSHSPQVALPLTFAIEHALVADLAVLGHHAGRGGRPQHRRVDRGHRRRGLLAGRDRAGRRGPRAGLQELPPSGLMAVAAHPGAGRAAAAGRCLDRGRHRATPAGGGRLARPAGRRHRRAGAGRPDLPTGTGHPAVHGPIAASAVPAFEQAMRGLSLAAPAIELYSANTGRLTSPPRPPTPGSGPGNWSSRCGSPTRWTRSPPGPAGCC